MWQTGDFGESGDERRRRPFKRRNETMLILAILTWGRDLIFQPIESLQKAKDLRRRIGSDDRDFVVYEGHLLCPIKLDEAVKIMSEEDITEWLHTDVLPALLEEGRVEMMNGKYISKKGQKIIWV